MGALCVGLIEALNEWNVLMGCDMFRDSLSSIHPRSLTELILMCIMEAEVDPVGNEFNTPLK